MMGRSFGGWMSTTMMGMGIAWLLVLVILVLGVVALLKYLARK